VLQLVPGNENRELVISDMRRGPIWQIARSCTWQAGQAARMR
jgi:hypothetical protein